jgi:putative salt-induced outer membrane protein YdiY
MLVATNCKRISFVLLFAAATMAVATSASGRAKTDVVVLNNGDTITGEIKELYRGLLKLSTDAMSTVNIEWDDVKTLTSRYYFEIEDKDGYKYYGTPEMTEDGQVRVTRADAVVSIEKLQLIRITPIKKSFWSRIDGSVSLGVSYTKGSDIGRVDFAFDARYRVEKNFLQLNATSNLTTGSTVDSTGTTQRTDASFTHQHLFARKVFSDLTLSTFRNDEQGIAFRGTFGAGIGANLIQSNSHLFLSTLGLSVNREYPTDPNALTINNLEGVYSLGYSIFKYDTPKTSLTSNATVYPRLPDFDRVRFDADASLTQEIVKDFTVALTFYYDFNSEPPSENDSKEDWGFTTSFGYKF